MRALLPRQSRVRLATRVLMRLARSPYRGEEDDTKRHFAVKWSNGSARRKASASTSTRIRSPLKSLEFATLRIKDAVCDRFARPRRRPGRDTRSPEVRIQASSKGGSHPYLDTSGEPLTSAATAGRGEAPLKRTLPRHRPAHGLELRRAPSPTPCAAAADARRRAAMMAPLDPAGHARAFGFERLAGFDLRR